MTQTKKLKKTQQNFPVVGIGAATGGLDAFIEILQVIPKNTGMAYLLVQQLHTDESTITPETLAKHTKMPVHEIINDINLAANHIYIIPENNFLIVEDDVLKLRSTTRSDIKNATIDNFFESLAEVHKSFAIGVVLSGTDFDGTNGLKKIKELGGVTIAQNPLSASFKGMPQSAIDSEVVDYVLAPSLIPQKLIEIQKSYVTNHGYSESDDFPKNEQETLMQIINVVFLRTGNDFRHYKQATIRRRIARRMVITRKDTLLEYFYLLRNDKTEQEMLFNDFLIPVTFFFRDSKVFESLPELVFPKLIQNTVSNSLRIWVAGCATGEEAYSLAIMIHEYLAAKNIKDIKVQIFASDISEKCISKARSAMYSYQDVQHVSPSRLQDYFTKRDGHYHINKVIRDMCIFAVHNFIKDPPFARINLVSCRNVLIYLNPFLQNKVLSSFHYSLNEKGILVLGKSETSANAEQLFQPLNQQEKIYTRKFTPARYVPEAFKPSNNAASEKVSESDNKRLPVTDFRKIAMDFLFQEYTPASVIINEHLEIVHFHGDTSSFLSPPVGKPNFNVLKMVNEDISFELHNAILKIRRDGQKVLKKNMVVKNQTYLTSFEVVSIPDDKGHVLVIFYKKPLPELESNSKIKRKKSDQLRISTLETELKQLRDDLKRVTEEQQTAFEELQTTNEELLSSSEELQTINEEFETSTEELQSKNGELIYVNDELLDRHEQLISTRNYLESVFRTIREPLVIIDKNFFVKSANPSFYKYFNTTEKETEGYSFFEIAESQWDIPEFRHLINKVLDEKTYIEDFKLHTAYKGGEKIMIVNARLIPDTKPSEMILLALEDITDLAAANALLTFKNAELQNYNEELESFSLAANHDLQEPLRKIQMFNKRVLDTEKNLSETSIHNIERTLFASVNMSQLITDLINYSRIIFLDKEYEKTDLNTLLKKTNNGIKNIILKKMLVLPLQNYLS